MCIRDSRGHVDNLAQQGEVIRVDKQTDPSENVAAIGWKTYNRLGKATLFTDLKGFPGWRMVNQVIADRRKWSIAFGTTEDDLVPALVERVRTPVATVEVDKSDAPVKQVIKIGADADLLSLPAMWTSERDPAPYIASGMAVIKDPETGIRNLSFHRQQIMGLSLIHI